MAVHIGRGLYTEVEDYSQRLKVQTYPTVDVRNSFRVEIPAQRRWPAEAYIRSRKEHVECSGQKAYRTYNGPDRRSGACLYADVS